MIQFQREGSRAATALAITICTVIVNTFGASCVSDARMDKRDASGATANTFVIPNLEDLGRTEADKEAIKDNWDFFESAYRMLKFHVDAGHACVRVLSRTIGKKLNLEHEAGGAAQETGVICTGKWSFEMPIADVVEIRTGGKEAGYVPIGVTFRDGKLCILMDTADGALQQQVDFAGPYGQQLGEYKTDYELERFLFTTDFTKVDLRTLNHTELATTLVLMRAKCEHQMISFKHDVAEFTAPGCKGLIFYCDPSNIDAKASTREQRKQAPIGVSMLAGDDHITVMVVPGVGASPTELCESSWGTTKQLLSTWREHNLKDPAREMLKQARELLDRGDDEDKRQAVIFLKLAQQYESGSSKEITDLLAKLQKEHGSMRGDEKHDVR